MDLSIKEIILGTLYRRQDVSELARTEKENHEGVEDFFSSFSRTYVGDHQHGKQLIYCYGLLYISS